MRRSATTTHAHQFEAARAEITYLDRKYDGERVGHGIMMETDARLFARERAMDATFDRRGMKLEGIGGELFDDHS